jgi:hypothetical protein
MPLQQSDSLALRTAATHQRGQLSPLRLATCSEIEDFVLFRFARSALEPRYSPKVEGGNKGKIFYPIVEAGGVLGLGVRHSILWPNCWTLKIRRLA